MTKSQNKKRNRGKNQLFQ